MQIHFLDEPQLEFGDGGRHVDVRFGIAQHGPFDRGATTAPVDLKVGLVGTSETVEGLRSWLDRCRNGVPGKETRLTNLFPGFPGFSDGTCFGSNLVFNERWTAEINKKEIEELVASSDSQNLASLAVDLFLGYGRQVLEQGGPAVLLCAPSQELLAALENPLRDRRDPLEEEIDEGGEPGEGRAVVGRFHDLLKARCLELRVPIQMVRPRTYGSVVKGKVQADKPLQDEATRAWNLHTALYYKAGGIPWRLLRDPSDLTTCFVGVSFYRSPAGDRLMSSVAHVFNERGEGIVVKGGDAQVDKDDLQPHLSEQASSSLLKKAVAAYRSEHRTQPARVVLHKTSQFSPGERSGFSEVADTERIDTLDLLSVRRSFTRLFREGPYPPLRGTLLELDRSIGLLYLRGSVDFFRSYPGLYVPRPLAYLIEKANTTTLGLASEMLALSKLNWNNTQFDGGEPITVRAARRVGDILKHVEEGDFQGSFRFFM